MADQPGTSVGVPAETHAFPPFDKQTFPSQVLWLALSFATLYLLMSRLALPRVGAILGERRRRIDGDLGEARRLKGESETAAATYEAKLADARGRSQALVSDARRAQAADAETQRKSLDAALNTRIGEAEKGIVAARSAAMGNVRGIATEAAAAIIERLTGNAPGGRQDIEAAVADLLKH